MTIEIIIVHPPDYNEQANLPVVSLLSLRKKDGLSMGFKHNRVLSNQVAIDEVRSNVGLDRGAPCSTQEYFH
jgi:hypothetical protein